MNEKYILAFIKNFQNEGTITTFTQGCCYWFAMILYIRFIKINERDSAIMYNPVSNHFAFLFKNVLYDITGKLDYNENNVEKVNGVTVTDGWINWVNYENYDYLDYQRVVEQCVYKN